VLLGSKKVQILKFHIQLPTTNAANC